MLKQLGGSDVGTSTVHKKINTAVVGRHITDSGLAFVAKISKVRVDYPRPDC
jgi:hypothetical protein